ncbi:hypothetical protein FA95DRAFT_1614055 [Auriscalpium vulgare]|uniref:Uncharacterized protein n=1 Tax=Auriscalpium vulgare TaxID=40419 RepID=A0ACB8R0G5_9AGAM|nr:hypothetical protein FA95DRAFT_1614055 [Auriscalpium vulgare]
MRRVHPGDQHRRHKFKLLSRSLGLLICAFPFKISWLHFGDEPSRLDTRNSPPAASVARRFRLASVCACVGTGSTTVTMLQGSSLSSAIALVEYFRVHKLALQAQRARTLLPSPVP